VHRYLALNPVRAKQVVQAEAWRWSSYAAVVGTAPMPAFLATGHVETLGSVEDFRALIASGAIRDRVTDSARTARTGRYGAWHRNGQRGTCVTVALRFGGAHG
jgi:hypothetical protein